MTDRDRLIELFSPFADGTYNGSGTIVDGTKVDDVVDSLLANGVIVPTVKVGQTVWVIPKGLHEVCKATIVKIEYNYCSNPQEWMTVEYVSSIVGVQEYKSRIDLMLGKTVFLTLEEAEEKLKELGK